jgi:hypothetical protein
MRRVEELLSAYIAEQRASGRADPIPYLAELKGTDRAELTVLIDHFLATAQSPRFDPTAFERFRAQAEVAEISERILGAGEERLVALRQQAGVSKQGMGELLARDLGLEGSEAEAKACYHDIETGAADPARVRAQVWESLATALSETVEVIRAAATTTFPGPRLGGAFARTESMATLPGVQAHAGLTAAQRRVHEAFFEPE